MRFQLLIVATSLAVASVAAAHPGQRVWLANDAGSVTTYTSDNDLSPTTFTPSRLFAGTLDEFLPGTDVFTTDFPGYELKTVDGGVAPGTQFTFSIPGPLLAYDTANRAYKTTAELFGNSGPAPQIAVSEGNSVTRTGDGSVAGFDFFTYTTPGDHAHMFYTLFGDGATASNGPDAVYALPMEVIASGLTSSETYYLLLGKGVELDSPTFDAAIAVARATLLGGPPADVNVDGRVDALDLLAVRQHMGERDAPWDVNRDGRVNAVDLQSVRQELRRADGTPAPVSVVPEPSSLVLLMVAAAWVLRRSR